MSETVSSSARGAQAADPGNSPNRPASAAGVLTIAFAACAAFGAKLMLIRAYGSDVPYMDQWDAEGRLLLGPHVAGSLPASNFLLPHNEHRVVLTRLLNFGLTVANRQWDPLLEMTVNAAIHAGFCALILAFARRLVGGARFAAAALVITALFVLGFDWENTLQGFQSQFYLLEWGALGMLWLCVPAQPLGARWWAGWLVGIAGLGSMSSGFAAAAATLAVMLAQAALARAWSWRRTLAAVLLGLICVAGLLSITHVPGHDQFRAASPLEWLGSLAHALSWPLGDWPAALAVLQLPAVLLAFRCLRARALRPLEAVLLGLAGWSWLQVAALAYARAGEGMLMSPRYMDLYAVQSAVNAVALAALWRRGRPLRTAAWAALALGWCALLSAGLFTENRRAYLDFLDDWPRLKAAEHRHLRAFLATGDADALRAAPNEELPYPDPEVMIRLLAVPGVPELMPVGIRRPLRLLPQREAPGFARTSGGDLPPVDASAGRVWFAARGPARVATAPLPAFGPPLLHLSFCGSPDLDASVIRIESPAGADSAPPMPVRSDRWQSVDLEVRDRKGARLVIDLPPGDHWFAVTEPLELGLGSWADRWLLRRAPPIAWTSASLFAAACAALVLTEMAARRRDRRSPGHSMKDPR